MGNKQVCIGGDLYEIIPDSTTTSGSVASGGNVVSPQVPSGMSITETEVTQSVDMFGGGNYGGGYRSINITVPKHEKYYQIPMGMYADQLNMRSDQALTVNFNNQANDNIFIAANEFPFVVSGLKLNEAITSIFVTTGDNDAYIQILAFGLVV